ncbi:uncharacterized protein Dvir_GJ14032 [Drosophila virilis]|uniref:Fibrinogen C-terminal domain-containing protein n=2 Tax=Drosophila virilis TaxID=7244 RepID=B4LC62_DROVI|nr:uncharacterized protein Dvir_GJ14032 [Drosophila virilis]
MLIIDKAQANKNESGSVTKIAEEQSGEHIYKAVRPLLKYIYQMKEEIENNNNIVESKDREIKQLQEKLAQHNEFYKETIKELMKNVLSIKEEMGKPTSNSLKVQEYEEQLEKQKKLIDQKEQQISEIKNEVNICAKKLKSYKEKPDYSDCTPFGDDPGIHKIKPDQGDPFDVLCDSATAGPGWMVIQQKTDNMMNFYREWSAYRNGFGGLADEFFLGLEKIHRLTSAQPHELYVHVEDSDGVVEYYRYELFTVAGEDDQYRLTISGQAEGNATFNMFYYHNNQQFSTFDRVNVNCGRNCAHSRNIYGGWWYSCVCDKSSDEDKAMSWNPWYLSENVKMLIRPKNYTK